MSSETSTRSIEQLVATRDMLRREIGDLEHQILRLTDEIQKCHIDKDRIQNLLASIEGTLAEMNVPPAPPNA